MRLLIGLDLPDDLVGTLEKTLRPLKSAAPLQWTPAANLHITTKFIGHWPAERLDELKAALAGVPSRPPIRVAIRSLGFFTRIFWCGIDAPGLAELAADTDACTWRLGVPSEERAFSPHLTLARIKRPVDLKPLRRAICGIVSQDFGNFTAQAFFLYQSTPKPSGSVYTKLAEFPLTRP